MEVAVQNTLNRSDVEYTTTFDCSLNAFSSDQIDEFNSNASAKYGLSFSCGDNFEASLSKCSHDVLGNCSITLSNNENKYANVTSLIRENFMMRCLSESNSLNANEGVKSFTSLMNNNSISFRLSELYLKKENSTLASTTSIDGIKDYHPFTSALSLSSLPHFIASLSVTLEFLSNSSATLNINLSDNLSLSACTTKVFTSFFGSCSMPPITSSGTSTVNSAIVSPNDDYCKMQYLKVMAFDPIVSIKAHEPQHVYDLEIENTHNFVANGIVAHNTYVKGFGNAINMTGNVLYFRFNNDTFGANGTNLSREYDWSNSGNNGTFYFSNGTVGFNVSGKLKLGVEFDAYGDYIDAGNNSITGTSAFTLIAWIKTNTLAGYSTGAVSIGNSASGQSAYIGNVGQADVGPSNSIGGGFHTIADIGSGITTINQWVHVVLTFTGGAGGTTKIYVDGAERATTTVTPNLGSTYRRIGRLGSDTNIDFNGSIDEVAIFNRTLSAVEIKAIYDRQKGQFIDRGQYESPIFDAGVSANWTNISWFTEVPYGKDLPDNRRNESDNRDNFVRGINMTGN